MSLIRTPKEEGHYTLKRVKRLPKRGNYNILYALRTTDLDRLYRWLQEGKYEEILLGGGGITEVISGTDITVDNTDPKRPVVNFSGSTIRSVTGGTNVTVDNTDAENPIIDFNGSTFNSVVAGAEITIDNTDPDNPIVGTTENSVLSVVGGANVSVDNTDPRNPIVNTLTGITSLQAGPNITIDATNPSSPIVSSTGGGGLNSVVAGTDISVDDTDPLNPIVNFSGTSGGTLTSVQGGSGIGVNNTDPNNPIVSAQGLELVTEGPNTGWRLIGKNVISYTNLGDDSIDMSFELGGTPFKGATGRWSLITGLAGTSSGVASYTGGDGGIASGDVSFTYGSGLLAPSRSEAAFGLFNTQYVALSPTSYAPTDRIFSVGNGTNGASRSDALIIHKGGDVIAPSMTTPLIDGEATGRVLITKEWFNANIGGGGGVSSVVAGTNVTVDVTDPTNPVVGVNNLVTLDTFQMVTGTKIFAGDISFNGGIQLSSTTAEDNIIEINGTNVPSTPLGFLNNNAMWLDPSANLFVQRTGVGQGSMKLTNGAAIGENREHVFPDKDGTVAHLTDLPSVVPPTGLEAIDEGNGTGWRLVGKNAGQFGNIGAFATDLSENPLVSAEGATGAYSFAFGRNVTANNTYAIAGGSDNQALAALATSIGGSGNTASGVQGSAIVGGINNTASGIGAAIYGASNSTAVGNNSIVLGGAQNDAISRSSAIVGATNSVASGISASIFGGDGNTASGVSSSTIGGIGNTAPSLSETVIGQYATEYSPTDPSSFDVTDRIFNIGNGTGTFNRSNALTVFKSGLVTAPAVTNTIIDAGSAKSLVTKEWVNANASGGGNFVTTDTVQDITARKTFTQFTTQNNFVLYRENISNNFPTQNGEGIFNYRGASSYRFTKDGSGINLGAILDFSAITGLSGENKTYSFPDSSGTLALISDIPSGGAATGLELVTEGGRTGWRLAGRDPSLHQDIGGSAIDLTVLGDTGIAGATGFFSFAAGQETLATGFGSVAFGNQSHATDDYAFTAGNLNVASGHSSAAFGFWNFARAIGEFSVGQYGTDYTPDGTNDRVFNVGIGLDNPNRVDGLTVLRSGEVLAPDMDNTKIGAASNKVLVTKEYADANYDLVQSEGTWTPDLSTSINNSYTFTDQGSNYYRIGKQVTVSLHVDNIADPVGGTGVTGDFEVRGLPFTVANTINSGALKQDRGSSDSIIGTSINGVVGDSKINFGLIGGFGGTQQNVSYSGSGNQVTLQLTFTYLTDDA